jgi:hypothetical protein
MILSSKNKEDMSKEELLKLDIMTTLAEAKGYSLNGPEKLNFQEGSAFDKAASLLISKFDISVKGETKKPKEKADKDVSTENSSSKKTTKKKVNNV